ASPRTERSAIFAGILHPDRILAESMQRLLRVEHPTLLERKIMTLVSRYASCLSISLFVAFIVTGCHSNQNQASSNPSSPDQSQDQAQDPTSANLAPTSNASTSVANAPANSPQASSEAYSDQG